MITPITGMPFHEGNEGVTKEILCMFFCNIRYSNSYGMNCWLW